MKIKKKHILFAFLIVVFMGACTFPFTTATDKWNIKWDKDKLAFKEKFLKQELPEFSGEKPPNILFIVVDDLGKYEIPAYGSETMNTPEIDEPDENKRVYHAMIHALDDAIGGLMEKMKALGLDENTLIFFISDNGGASYTGVTDNGPYKGGKLTMFEGGVNVPFIMKWKGHIPEGIVWKQYENHS